MSAKYIKLVPAAGHDQYSRTVKKVCETDSYSDYLNWTNCFAVVLNAGETLESKGFTVVSGA